MSAWHFWHDASVIALLRGVARMCSGYQPVVKAKECQKPLLALVTYLPMTPLGVWQSLQTATAR